MGAAEGRDVREAEGEGRDVPARQREHAAVAELGHARHPPPDGHAGLGAVGSRRGRPRGGPSRGRLGPRPPVVPIELRVVVRGGLLGGRVREECSRGGGGGHGHGGFEEAIAQPQGKAPKVPFPFRSIVQSSFAQGAHASRNTTKLTVDESDTLHARFT